MNPNINAQHAIDSMLKVGAFFGTREVYLAGGAMCQHQTKDLDIVILSKFNHAETFDDLNGFYRAGMCQTIAVYKAYGITSEGAEDDGKFHTKAVTSMDGVKVDLLFADIDYYPTIFTILDKFPLSIQMQAMRVDGLVFTGRYHSSNPIYVHRIGAVDSAITKYKEYYPTTPFINVITGEEI